jgi:hypothetical protein
MSSSPISKTLMWVSLIGIQWQLQLMETGLLVKEKWEAYGNGLARHWRDMKASNPCLSIQHIQASHFVVHHNTHLISLVDFFDGKHNIVLGGSWATHPRIAGRKTL